MQTCKFTLEHYEFILKTALKAGYKFVGFDEKLPEQCCILRHDVDYMPEWALRLGQIENRLGVKSTFFFQVSASTYNLGSFYNRCLVKGLLNLGHSVGVHVDLSGVDDVGVVVKEKKLFELVTGIKPCEIVSVHNPCKDLFGKNISGIRHTYEKEYFKDIKYLSDSRNWYEGCVCKIFDSKKYNRIQLLTHPYIWHNCSEGFVNNIVKVTIYFIYTNNI